MSRQDSRPPVSGKADDEPSLPASRVELVARAKINLFLEVGPRRADGYHSVTTVMQTVDLADTVVLERATATSVTFARGPGYAGPLPEPPDLVATALEVCAAELRGLPPVTAEVTKQIPMAAGLAGGSADAAAAVGGADALAGAGTPRGRLEALCRRLGSDVAFCLRGGTALARGRGDQLSPMACRHRIWWVLGISGFPLPTVDVYRRFDELGGPGGHPVPGAAPGGHPARPNRLADALAAGHPKAIAPLLRNDLQLPAFDLAQSLPGMAAALEKAGALRAILTGSGPTIAGICRDEAHAEEVAARAEGEFPRVELVASTPLGAEVVRREP
ncbi:MAG TPA: 4-(cytidine 5'-diphospho)-2-C-methyl-D-erythritol kinase [Actinomycetota bacterium]|nr:4-(cytidine 5'-diphospho)-2-C-methyl-D-erythritol kinase [Actinomycetota bacterium]